MSLVDWKYARNQMTAQIAEIETGILKAQLDSLADYEKAEREALKEADALQEQLDAVALNYDLQRDTLRASIKQIKEIGESRLIEIESNEWGQQVSARGNESPGQVIYGECRTGGQITFLTADQGDSGQFIHMMVTIACHEIDGFTQLYVDGEVVNFASSIYPDGAGWATDEFNNLIFFSGKSLGSTDQVANSDLVSQSAALFPGQWTASHRQRGYAGAYLIMMYAVETFPNGIPDLTFAIKGKTDIYDPRDLSTGYSNNAALCLANYLMDTEIGPGYTQAEIDLVSLADAADVCDENVSLIGGGSEKRYACNGVFTASANNNHQAIIRQMCLAMGGDICSASGKWRFYPGKWRSPVVSLSERNLRSGLKVSVKPGKDKVFNRIKGKYRGTATAWEWADYSPVKNSLYQSQDGEKIWEEIDQPFVKSNSQCQRIAKIKLEEARQCIQVEASFDLTLFQAYCGENITLTYDRFGWSAKQFRLIDYVEKEVASPGGPVTEIDAVLQETASGVYDWDSGEQTTVDLAPNTNLPSPLNLPAPANLALASGTAQLDIRSDGTIFSRIYVSWDSTTNVYILSDGKWHIQYKKTTESEWRTSGYVDGTITKHWILDVADGQAYDVRVRAETIAKGAWTTITGYAVLGKEESPTPPTNLTATMSRKGILLAWDGISDLDLAGYEVRSGATFGAGSYVDITRSTSYLIATQAAGSYAFSVAAKDTSSLYSDAVAINIEIAAPPAISGLTGLVVYNMVQLAWSAVNGSSFPVKEYNIYKGSTFGSATLLGAVNATLKTIQEFTSGNYTYWITAVDEYGNEGTETSINLTVDAPPLFQLLSDVTIDFSAGSTLTNCVVENGALIGPVDKTITLEDHFDDNTWSTPQDQIDDGYPIYAQPAAASNAIYEGVIDFGSTISTVLINLSYLSEWVDGDGDIIPTISYSADGSSYTAGTTGATQIIGSSFRYVKIKIEIDGDDLTSIARISEGRVRLEIKRTADSGTVSAASGDASGTEIAFNETFLDVFEGTIKLLPQGSSAYFASYAITGNTVKVFLWNTSGSRVSGTVAWSIEGIVSA